MLSEFCYIKLKKAARLLAMMVMASAGLAASAYYDGDPDADAQAPYIPMILIVNNDDEAADLESKGVVIWRRRADMALALVPRDLPTAAKSPGMARSPRVRRAMPVMDVAKTHFDASAVLSGRGLPAAYTGKGVVVGFCDTGFDPHHVNFLDRDGNSRVRRIVYYDEPQGVRQVMDTPEEIAAWITDSPDQTHATHVAGIMTGAYDGNGYSGMAPDAEIVAVTSQLYDAGVLSACEDIIEYARSVGKPAVINLSIGSYNGPHDGSSLFNRYMALLGEEAVICMASGNEGNKGNTYRMTFSDERKSWRTRIQSTDWKSFDMYGMTDVWSADDRPVAVRLLIYDGATGNPVYESDLCDGKEPYVRFITDASDPEFGRFMTGMVTLSGYVSEFNGRWVTEVEYETHTDEPNPDSDGNWARYNIGIEISGEPGVHADVTCDCQYSKLVTWRGYPAPTSDLSVSDISTGDNVICVGMYNNRSEVPDIGGGFRPTGFEPLQVHDASGYATLVDGRVLPHSVAPGGGVVSSANTAYVAAHPEIISSMNACADVDGKTYYWNTNSGTSMSTPYLAGVVASWLEVNPSLTVDDVKSVIASTNSHDCYDSSNPRNGRGWLQPYEGIKLVIQNSGITAGKVDSVIPSAVMRGDVAEILNPTGRPLTVSVYSVDGAAAMGAVIVSDPVSSVDVSSLASGVYVLVMELDSQRPVQMKFIR